LNQAGRLHERAFIAGEFAVAILSRLALINVFDLEMTD
jgi:hypothetical protein